VGGLATADRAEGGGECRILFVANGGREADSGRGSALNDGDVFLFGVVVGGPSGGGAAVGAVVGAVGVGVGAVGVGVGVGIGVGIPPMTGAEESICGSSPKKFPFCCETRGPTWSCASDWVWGRPLGGVNGGNEGLGEASVGREGEVDGGRGKEREGMLGGTAANSGGGIDEKACGGGGGGD